MASETTGVEIKTFFPQREKRKSKKRNHVEEVILKAPSSFEHTPCSHSLRTKPHCSHRPAPLGTGPRFPTSAASFLRHNKQHLLLLFLRLGAFFLANVRAVSAGSALIVVEKPVHKTGKTQPGRTTSTPRCTGCFWNLEILQTSQCKQKGSSPGERKTVPDYFPSSVSHFFG